jgi:hypothetical protein
MKEVSFSTLKKKLHKNLHITGYLKYIVIMGSILQSITHDNKRITLVERKVILRLNLFITN